MKTYRVNLIRTTTEVCTVTVDALNKEEATELAIDEHMGFHNWQNQETAEISATDVEEVEEVE